MATRGGRGVAGHVVLGVAIVLLVVVPLVPGFLAAGTALAPVRIPVESIVVLLVLSLVPGRRPRILLAALYGAFVVAALILAGVDRGYEASLGIHFDPLDWPQLGDAFGVAADALGVVMAAALVALAALVAILIATAMAWAALRVDAVIRRRRRTAALAATAAVWIVAALVAPPPRGTTSLAAAASADSIGSAVSRASVALGAESTLAARIADDPYAATPGPDLLTALRGKDVVIAFIESYGRAAVAGTSFSAGVDEVLRQGDAALRADGYSSRSAWLTSPTFGGISWLAHSTLQTGLWVDSQSVYDRVVSSDRFTLSDAFRRAGWRTVSDVPSDGADWPVGSTFYHYGTLLNGTNVGYRGPRFGYAAVPDQYTWKHFADTVLAPGHPPVMAEIDLVSSHTPWAPLPRLLPWSQLGDGAAFDAQPAMSEAADVVWRSPQTVQRFYGESVQYALGAMLSFLREVDDPGLVVVALGDHQPATIVSGAGADHDVPVSIIAKDPAVFRAIAGWRWQPGLQPGADAPLWRMDAFRDRFLAAFGSSG